MLQKHCDGWSIVSVPANIRPGNVAGLVNHKHGGSGSIILKQVKHAKGIGYLVILIRQDRIAGLNSLRHGEGPGHILISQGNDFGPLGLKGGIILLQLTELQAACPSGLATIENQYNGLFIQVRA